jgi:acyl carrier protein
MIEEVIGIIGDILEMDMTNIDINMGRDQIEGWDSIKQIMIVAELENHFEIELNVETISDQNVTIAKLVHLIEARIS